MTDKEIIYAIIEILERNYTCVGCRNNMQSKNNIPCKDCKRLKKDYYRVEEKGDRK